jgi:FolB domain-containing protein
MTDTIHIHGLKLEVAIGFHHVEKGIKQTVEAELSIESDFRQGPQDDSHTGLVDYYELERRLRAHASTRSYELLEALAVDLARQTIAAHPNVRVRVRLTKHPLDMPGISSVSVECVREKSDF